MNIIDNRPVISKPLYGVSERRREREEESIQNKDILFVPSRDAFPVSRYILCPLHTVFLRAALLKSLRERPRRNRSICYFIKPQGYCKSRFPVI